MNKGPDYSSVDFENINRYYRTGAIAEICQVSVSTVAKWLDSGKIESSRIPCSKLQRRVHHKELLRFIKDYGLPIKNLEEYVQTHPE